MHGQRAALGLGGPIGVAGDSAGGQLALAAALSAPRYGMQLRHLGLLYPLGDPACDSESVLALGEHYMLTRAFLQWCWASYGAGSPARQEGGFDLTKADLAALPGTTVVTAEFDPLRDEGEMLAVRLRAAAVAVEHRRFAGMIHGFVGLSQSGEAGRQAITFIAEGFRSAFRR